MITVENVEVWGFEHAIRGMRNPLNSWSKSDSHYDKNGKYIVGDADMELMKRLFKAGPEHRKYLRQIFVSMDITAPLYWHKEASTYKVGTTTNSCSTMHKIQSKEFEMDDFSTEHLTEYSKDGLSKLLGIMNEYREDFNKCKNKDYWWQMIQLLPSSYNQKRTITMSYENVVSIIRQRTGHKLDEWNDFVDILRHLPYVAKIIE